VIVLQREVIVHNSTFIVNRYSSKDATETLEELLKRVVVQNAEREFKKRPFVGVSDVEFSDDIHPQIPQNELT